jgi:ribosomal-protein-alanine N-acetyltransferase
MKKEVARMDTSKVFPWFETARLVLREMTIADLDFYFHHFNDEKIVEGCAFPGPENVEGARKELELYCTGLFKEDKGARWGIVTKAQGILVGTCGLYNWKKTSRSAEIGYDLEPAYWGRGIMTEALRTIVKYGFQEMNLNRVQGLVDAENQRSLNLLERLGFKREGVFRQRTYFKGRFHDDVCLSLLHEEWKTHH